jgi:aspartate aminotransferase
LLNKKVFISNTKYLSFVDLSVYLLEEAHVACVDGDAFGAPRYLRFSHAANDEQIERTVERVKIALGKLV